MCTQDPRPALVSHGQLVSPQAFESTLKSWEDKQKGEAYRAPSRLRLSSQQSMEYLMEEEAAQMQQLVQATETLISRCQPRQTLEVAPLQRLPWGAAPQLGVCACGRCLDDLMLPLFPTTGDRQALGSFCGPSALSVQPPPHEILEEVGEQEEGVLHSSLIEGHSA